MNPDPCETPDTLFPTTPFTVDSDLKIFIQYRLMWHAAKPDATATNLIRIASELPFPANCGRVTITYSPARANDVDEAIRIVKACGFADFVCLPKETTANATHLS